MGRYSYPHVIDNGHGERITFIRVVPGPKGDRLEVENIVTPGSGLRCTSTTSRMKP
jgi:hypothetical protein